MIAVPPITKLDTVWGNIKHLPSRENLPEEFQKNWHSDRNPFCKAVSTWFYKGVDSWDGTRLVIGEKAFTPKDGVDGAKAIAAIQAALASFEPSHEHKIGGCGYLLSEWFDHQAK